MFGWLFPTRQDRALIPEGRLSGPMPWVIAIMVFLTVLAAAAGLAVRIAADAVNADLAGRVTVQIVTADAAARKVETAAALRRLRDQPQVARAVPVDDAQLAALLEPWLGAETLALADNDAEAADARDGDNDGSGTRQGGDAGTGPIPVPALIDVDLRGAAGPAALQRLRDALRGVAPSARVDANAAWLRPVADLLGQLQWLALGLIALLGTTLAAAVVLAVRAALNTHQETIAIVHLLGGTDLQVARLFQRRVALDAALGGTVGLVLAAVLVLVLADRAAALDSALVDTARFGWRAWLVLAAIPLAGALLALLTARFTVMRALGNTL